MQLNNSRFRIFATVFYLLLVLAPGKLMAEFVSDDGHGWTYEKVNDEFYEEDKNVQFRRGQSAIGLMNFDRRANLPRVRKGDKTVGLELGNLRVHPAYTQIFEVDDNVRLQRDDREADMIFKELPALSAEFTRGENFRVAGGYGMEIANYVDQTRENAINHFGHLLAEAYANNWRLVMEDTIAKEEGRFSNATSTRDELLTNSVQALVKYKSPKFSFEPGYTHHTVEHSAPNLKPFDYEEDIASVILSYSIFQKTSVLLQNDFGVVYYDDEVANADQAYWQVLTGIRGEYLTDLVTEIKVGFQGRRTDEFNGQDQQQDYHGIVADSNIAYKIGPRDAIMLDYTRAVDQSTFQNNSWYSFDKIELSYSKRLWDKIIITPKMAWQHNRYPQTAVVSGEAGMRRDHFWQPGIEFRYQWREWASAGLAYKFKSRSSSFDNFDYTNNRYLADIRLSY